MPAAWELVHIDGEEYPKPESAVVEDLPEEKKFLMVVIPHTGTVTMDWVRVFRKSKWPEGTKFMTPAGMPIDVARDMSARAAVEKGYEWIFFWDSDVMLPDGAVQKLLEANTPLVNGMYVAKRKFGDGFFWDMWMRVQGPDGKIGATNVMDWGDARYFDQADFVGAGCMLVHRSVFEKISEMYPGLPYFYWTISRKPEGIVPFPDPMMNAMSEDFFFCALAKACGFRIVVDTSIRCGHMTTSEFCEKSMEMQKIEILDQTEVKHV